jgi:nicotinamide riboside kinase
VPGSEPVRCREPDKKGARPIKAPVEEYVWARALSHHLPLGSQMAITSIYVVGPSSTGKTTLCGALFKHFTAEFQSQSCRSDGRSVLPHTISEVARKVMREHQFTRADMGTLEMQQAILKAQTKAEKDAVEHLATSDPTRENVLIVDRTAVDALVYCRKYVSEDAYKNLCKTSEFQEALRRYGVAKVEGSNGARVLFILTLPVAEWLIDDGVRHLDEPEAVLEEFRYVLNEWEIPFVELGRDIMELGRRVEWVVSKAHLDASMSIRGASHRR